MQHFYINPNIFERLENGNFEPVYFDSSSLWNKRMYDMRTKSKVPNSKEVYGYDAFIVRLFNTNHPTQSLIATVTHEIVYGKEINGEIEFKNQRFNKLNVLKVEKPKEGDMYGRT